MSWCIIVNAAHFTPQESLSSVQKRKRLSVLTLKLLIDGSTRPKNNYPRFLSRGNFSPIHLTLRWYTIHIWIYCSYFILCTFFRFVFQNSTWRFLRRKSAALPTTHRPNWTLLFWSSEGSFLLRTCSTPSSMIITYSPDPITNSDYLVIFVSEICNQSESVLFCFFIKFGIRW